MTGNYHVRFTLTILVILLWSVELDIAHGSVLISSKCIFVVCIIHDACTGVYAFLKIYKIYLGLFLVVNGNQRNYEMIDSAASALRWYLLILAASMETEVLKRKLFLISLCSVFFMVLLWKNNGLNCHYYIHINLFLLTWYNLHKGLANNKMWSEVFIKAR